MKRILFAGAVALSAIGPALAADLPQAPPPPPRAPAAYLPPVVPAYSWGGLYLGVNGGYAFGSSNWTALPSGSFSSDGAIVGGTIGANYQIGGFVLGIEGDFDWQNLKGNVSNGPCNARNGAAGSACETDSNWLATLRGRAGYAFDRVLLYGTAGGAAANVQAGLNPPSSLESHTQFGWTAGAGLEFALTDNFTARAEYLFVDLSNASCTACGGASTPVSLYENMVRLGVDFKFNGF